MKRREYPCGEPTGDLRVVLAGFQVEVPDIEDARCPQWIDGVGKLAYSAGESRFEMDLATREVTPVDGRTVEPGSVDLRSNRPGRSGEYSLPGQIGPILGYVSDSVAIYEGKPTRGSSRDILNRLDLRTDGPNSSIKIASTTGDGFATLMPAYSGVPFTYSPFEFR